MSLSTKTYFLLLIQADDDDCVLIKAFGSLVSVDGYMISVPRTMFDSLDRSYSEAAEEWDVLRMDEKTVRPQWVADWIERAKRSPGG